MQKPKTAAQRYEALAIEREPFLRRAREASALTIPTLLPPEGAGPTWEPQKLAQSAGSSGVQTLSAKLLLALFPPNTSCFRLSVDEFEMRKIEKEATLKTQLDAALSDVEKAVLVELETAAFRPTASGICDQLIVAGNALLHDDNGTYRCFKLDSYVTSRDRMGNVLATIIHEQVAKSTLPEDIQKQIGSSLGEEEEASGDGKPAVEEEKNLSLYTVCERVNTRWSVWQEIKGVRLKGSQGYYALEKCPFIPLRFTKLDGESYGRSYVENFIGDLDQLEVHYRALSDAGVAASKLLWLVKPNGVTNARALSRARNGDFVAGQTEDVACLRVEKQNDFAFILNLIERIEKRIERAFLMTAGIQRNAERVTAEEIRSLVQELETSLGGIYTVLAQEWQLPLINSLMARMAKEKRLPTLPKKIVRVAITTGLEALGRGNDLQKLRTFVAILRENLPPEQIAAYLKTGDFIGRLAAALSLNTDGLIRTEEEVQQAQAEAQQGASMEQLITKLGPETIRQAGAAMQQQPAATAA